MVDIDPWNEDIGKHLVYDLCLKAKYKIVQNLIHSHHVNKFQICAKGEKYKQTKC